MTVILDVFLFLTNFLVLVFLRLLGWREPLVYRHFQLLCNQICFSHQTLMLSMYAPLAKEKLDQFCHFSHHEDSIVDKEDRNYGNEEVSEGVAHASVNKSVEYEQEDADEVSHDFIEDVLVVDD